jgi:hypothetical protein
MLVEDLARAFHLVLQDYDRFKIDEIFHTAQTALQNRIGNSANYTPHAHNVRSAAAGLIRESNYASFPKRWKAMFEASRFASVSPERLGKMFEAAVPEDPQRAISSGELNGDKDAFQNARGAMNAFLGTCQQVNIRPMVLDESKAHFQLSFSELNYERSMEVTANILKRWSHAFNLIARYSMGEIDPVEIEYVGTTDLTLWLSSSFVLVPVILSYYNQLLDAVDRTIKTLTALNIMKDAGHPIDGPPDEPKIMESYASSAVEAFLKNIPMGAEVGQREELSGGIKVTSKLLIEDVLNGTRVQVEYFRDVVTVDKNQSSTHSEEQIRDLLANNSAVEMRIAEYSGKDRLLLFPKRVDQPD